MYLFWYIKSDAGNCNNFRIRPSPNPQTLILCTVSEKRIYCTLGIIFLMTFLTFSCFFSEVLIYFQERVLSSRTRCSS
jgi:hypothetical protein